MAIGGKAHCHPGSAHSLRRTPPVAIARSSSLLAPRTSLDRRELADRSQVPYIVNPHLQPRPDFEGFHYAACAEAQEIFRTHLESLLACRGRSRTHTRCSPPDPRSTPGRDHVEALLEA